MFLNGPGEYVLHVPKSTGNPLPPRGDVRHPHGHEFPLFLSNDSGQIVPTNGRGQPPRRQREAGPNGLFTRPSVPLAGCSLPAILAGEKEGASRPLLNEKLAQTAPLRGLLRTIWPRNRTIRTEPAVSEPAGRETPR